MLCRKKDWLRAKKDLFSFFAFTAKIEQNQLIFKTFYTFNFKTLYQRYFQKSKSGFCSSECMISFRIIDSWLRSSSLTHLNVRILTLPTVTYFLEEFYPLACFAWYLMSSEYTDIVNFVYFRRNEQAPCSKFEIDRNCDNQNDADFLECRKTGCKGGKVGRN